MRSQEFADLLGRLGPLTPQQKAVVIRHLNMRRAPEDIRVAGTLPEPIRCPHCAAPKASVLSWGQSHGFKRYRCKDCRRTFNALTGTPLAHLRKRERWERYGQALIEGVSAVVAESTRTRRSCGITASCTRQRAIRPSTRRVSSKQTRPSSWNLSKALASPPRHRGGVARKRGINTEQIPVLVVRNRSEQTADFKLAVLDAPPHQ
ncbi:hypothetical protein OTERR_15730 [Oryzomicrobium terrae]|uniref:Uncharacterized protein n=1 Tax=Oryzomicrobium terrae TaxID=1735038 RepID=A0A5C1E8V3_9RHOO|nr:hypothetical protein OTERR_15730 [Oryzomicrobium terrae]